MPNMDFPGPCPSCAGIDGCSTGVASERAQATFCDGLNSELNTWRVRLADALREENVSDLGDHISLIRSSVRELESIAERMDGICPSTLGGSRLSESPDSFSPGWLGG